MSQRLGHGGDATPQMLATGNPRRARGIAFLFVKHYKRFGEAPGSLSQDVVCTDEQRASCVVWCALDLSKINPVLRSVVLSKSAYAMRCQFAVSCSHCFQHLAKEYVSLEALFTASELRNGRALPTDMTRHPDVMTAVQQAIEKQLPLCVVELRFFCGLASCQSALHAFKRSLNVPSAKPKAACAFCKRSNDVKLRTCARCGLVKYCDSKCQKDHWSVHKVGACMGSNKSLNSNLTAIVYVQVIAGYQHQTTDVAPSVNLAPRIMDVATSVELTLPETTSKDLPQSIPAAAPSTSLTRRLSVATAKVIELTTPLQVTNVAELAVRTVSAVEEDAHERKLFSLLTKQTVPSSNKNVSEAFCVLKRKDVRGNEHKFWQCALCKEASTAFLAQVYHMDTEKQKSLDMDQFFLGAPPNSKNTASKTLRLLRTHKETPFVTTLVMPVCEVHRSAKGLDSADAFLRKHALHLLPGRCVAP